jgi:hypothetical protein
VLTLPDRPARIRTEVLPPVSGAADIHFASAALAVKSTQNGISDNDHKYASFPFSEARKSLMREIYVYVWQENVCGRKEREFHAETFSASVPRLRKREK